MRVIRRQQRSKDRGVAAMRPKQLKPAVNSHADSNADRSAQLLSTGAVARMFGVSPSTVTRWARMGVLKAVRTPGGHFRFRAEEARRRAAQASLDDFVRLD